MLIFATTVQAFPASKKFLALGDSYTIGEQVAADQRWPVQLAHRLRAEGVAIDDPQIIAKTGWTTDELSLAIDHENPVGPYGLVSLLIGVNNQYRGRDVTKYRDEFRALLRRAIAFAGTNASHVIVVSIPDWGATPFAAGKDRAAIAHAIDQFNNVDREEALAAGVQFVDITPITRTVGTDPTLVAGDGLHPSGKMYAKWVDLILPQVKQMLQK